MVESQRYAATREFPCKPNVPFVACGMSKSIESNVFWAVTRAGALTTRRLIQEFGPKPNWQGLIDRRLLREYHTGYGLVLALGPAARQAFMARPPKEHVPYVAGPSAVADRAFQMDALRELQGRGYTFKRHEYKRAGAVGGAARRGEKVTSQILRTYMAAPQERLRALQATWGMGEAYRMDHWGMYPAAVGHPCLYASVSSGGIKLPKLKALFQKHKADIHKWRHPLLIAVPEEGDLRAFIRGIETEHRRAVDALVKQNLSRNRPLYSLVELLILPPP